MGQIEIEVNVLRPASVAGWRASSLMPLLTAWEARRKGRSFPARADFDPLDFKQFLGRMVLWDVLESPRRFRFRLVGTEWVTRFGLDPTGTIVDDYPRAESRDYINDVLAKTVDWREPTFIRRTVMLNAQVCEYDALFMPLAADGETIDMILCGFEL